LLDTTSRSLAKIFVVLSMSETVPWSETTKGRGRFTDRHRHTQTQTHTTHGGAQTTVSTKCPARPSCRGGTRGVAAGVDALAERKGHLTSMDDHPKSAMGRLYCPSSAISPWMSAMWRQRQKDNTSDANACGRYAGLNPWHHQKIPRVLNQHAPCMHAPVSRREEAAHMRGSFLARWKLATFRTVVALSPMLESV